MSPLSASPSPIKAKLPVSLAQAKQTKTKPHIRRQTRKMTAQRHFNSYLCHEILPAVQRLFKPMFPEGRKACQQCQPAPACRGAAVAPQPQTNATQRR
eukprot:9863177-Alexandrium_andersonii.AAC.1